ncbi:uncharacterized protein DSM5745_05835 [Aspergillus mulundensis]|uniref:Uncharacterized protein n=1 Tax=Aspergillus mulundensis TaxID=1810919 RepID=A0A3D8RY44_9EURO|nr:hypothetical protein DSM5745_05835 [Aspergillus mulundensis]RDW78983.1 hypothetical protein DSM5745_05835 [Aspergillus mulundensis]
MTSITIAAKSSLFEPAHAPLTPFTRTQWRHALREIKLLYVQKQYKRCLARSSSILAGAREPINSIYKLYLHFYSAICYEAMGLYAHDYSSKKVPLLREALGCFAACLSAFPVEVEVESELEVELGQAVLVRRDSGVGFASHDEVECDFGPGYKGGDSDDVFGSETGIELSAVGEDPEESPSLSPSPSSSSTPTPYASTVGSRSRSRSISPADTIVTSITDFIDRTLDCPDDDPFLADSDCEDPISLELGVDSEDFEAIHILDEKDPGQGQPLVPSPLQVRKSKTARPLSLFLPSLDNHHRKENTNAFMTPQSESYAAAAMELSTRARARPLPSLPIACSKFNTDPSKRNTITPPPPPSLSLNAHIHAYNTSLSFLHTQISSTITHLQSQIQDVTALQQARATSRRSGNFQRSASFWSFSPVKDGTSSRRNSSYTQDSGVSSSRREGIADRISRLRAEGWDTVGLRNPGRGWKGEEYYREFCGMALDELYLG